MVASVSTRRLAVLLFLPACYTWRPVTLAPGTDYAPKGRVRVETTARSTDSLASAGSAGASGRRVVFDGARVEGDSLRGFRFANALGVRYGRLTGSKQHVAIPIADVQRADERHISAWRTTLAVVALLGVVAVAYGAMLGSVAAY